MTGRDYPLLKNDLKNENRITRVGVGTAHSIGSSGAVVQFDDTSSFVAETELGFDTTNHEWDAPSPGVYLIHSAVRINDVAADGRGRLQIRLAGVARAHSEIYFNSSLIRVGGEVTSVLRLNESDTVDVFLSPPEEVTVDSGISNSWVEIAQLW